MWYGLEVWPEVYGACFGLLITKTQRARRTRKVFFFVLGLGVWGDGVAGVLGYATCIR